MRINVSKKINRDRIEIVLLFLPGLIFFFLFTVFPIIKLFIMSFFEYNIGLNIENRFIGLENYLNVFSDQSSRIAISNTLYYALITVPGQIILGLIVAVLINSLSKGKLVYRIVYYLPVITSWVIVSVLFRYIFQNEGYLNYILVEVLKFSDKSIRWLDTRETSMIVYSIIGIWKGVGWSMTVFLAALTAIPKELYEASEVDGSGKIKQFLYITIPGIRGSILFSVVMLTIGAFNTFTPVKLITDGKPLHQTEFVLTWMYKNAFEFRNMGYAAALSFLVAVVISVITIIQFKFFDDSGVEK
jgi:multiple sugar transport system permease protein